MPSFPDYDHLCFPLQHLVKSENFAKSKSLMRPDFSMQTSYHVYTGHCVQKDPGLKEEIHLKCFSETSPRSVSCCSHNCIKITKKEDPVLSGDMYVFKVNTSPISLQIYSLSIIFSTTVGGYALEINWKKSSLRFSEFRRQHWETCIRN